MQVSIAGSGSACSPLPAAVLALAANFTAVQNMQGALPMAAAEVLEAHAKNAKEHFELARSLFKKASRAGMLQFICWSATCALASALEAVST